MANAIAAQAMQFAGPIIDGADQYNIDPIQASQTYIDGEILVYNTPGSSNVLNEAGANPTNIVGVADGNATATWQVVASATWGVSTSEAMGTIENSGGHYFKAVQANVFEANLMGKTLAQLDMGTSYGVTKQTGALWTLDSSKAGTSVRMMIVGFQQNDTYYGGIGDSGARVLCKFLQSASFWNA